MHRACSCSLFDPKRGEWDPEWNGWWGDDPPYHAPVFVLTHYPRDPLPMDDVCHVFHLVVAARYLYGGVGSGGGGLAASSYSDVWYGDVLLCCW